MGYNSSSREKKHTKKIPNSKLVEIPNIGHMPHESLTNLFSLSLIF
jgi:pimeloyl-ACP methyl ester carboxylesterase